MPIFERDVKRLKKKHYDLTKLEAAIQAVFDFDEPRLQQLRDHALKGNWLGYRELHVDADWLLIYRINNDELELPLTRTGPHDELL